MANAQNIKDIAEFSISDSSLHRIVKVISGLNSCNKKLQDKYIELIDKARHLQIENANKDIFLAKFKAKNITKSKKIRSLESMIKILEGKLSLAQKDAISIQNIKSELESKINKLEYLKSEAILKPIIGGDDEKNISNSSRGGTPLQSNNISVVSEPSHLVTAPDNNDISKYFIHRKNMDQVEKINTIIPDHTNDKNTPIPKSNSQIPIGKIGAIPVVASSLMLPLLSYIFLTLLIIAIIWFMILRCIWGLNKKSNQFQKQSFLTL